MNPDTDDKMLSLFVHKIEDLQTKRQHIDDTIVALDMAYEALAGHPRAATAVALAKIEPVTMPALFPTYTPGEPREPRAPRKTAKIKHTGNYALDKDANPKTLAYLLAKRRPTSIESVAGHFKIERSTAAMRLKSLVKSGQAVIVDETRGHMRFGASDSARKAAEES